MRAYKVYYQAIQFIIFIAYTYLMLTLHEYEYMLGYVTIEIFCRHGKKSNIVCIPMRKCVINKDNPTLHCLTNDTVDVNQFVSSSPSSLSEGQYNTLKFNYDTGCDLPPKAYASFPTTPHEGLSSDHHKNHDSNSFACSGNFQMHSDHNTALTRHNTTNIALLQANGYVLPDDFGKQSHNFANFTDENQVDKKLNATHEAAFILKPDGTGIIRTGTLQAIIPSSKNDEDYMVTPSQTHESYFNVVKNT